MTHGHSSRSNVVLLHNKQKCNDDRRVLASMCARARARVCVCVCECMYVCVFTVFGVYLLMCVNLL